MITLFSWGYWGWGNATKQLKYAVDMAEEKRGFKSPTFVDIRLQRQVRAKGFCGDAFARVVGSHRYCWMRDLGNEKIATHQTGIKIVRPEAVSDLLELAVRAADNKSRVIFYCACEFPRDGATTICHRHTVGDLLLREAEKKTMPVAIVEWPGGDPTVFHAPLAVGRKLFSEVRNGRMYIPFDGELVSRFAGTAWGSILRIEHDGESLSVAIGPPAYTTAGDGSWRLPLIVPADDGEPEHSLKKRAAEWRRETGLDERRVS